jgi:hypothetical protein
MNKSDTFSHGILIRHWILRHAGRLIFARFHFVSVLYAQQAHGQASLLFIFHSSFLKLLHQPQNLNY